MYKVGDRVKFLNDVGGGVITKVVSKNMVNVENADGFEIPVLTSEIILAADQEVKVEKPTIEKFVQQGTKPQPVVEEEPEEEPVYIKGNDDPRFYLAFVPENSQNPLEGQISIFLINDCNYFLLYHYSHYDGITYNSQEAGKLEPNTKLQLGAISEAEISDLPAFSFQLIFYKEEAGKLDRPVSKTITINPVKFYKAGSFSKTDFFKSKAMLFKLNETDFDKSLQELTKKDVEKVIRKKEPARKVRKEPKTELSETLEVDLHIHELIDTTAGMSNKDMLDLQMSKFQETMDVAIKSNTVKRVVFIHGMGNGTLKTEVRRALSSKYKKYAVQDASFREYGYGATMVIIRK